MINEQRECQDYLAMIPALRHYRQAGGPAPDLRLLPAFMLRLKGIYRALFILARHHWYDHPDLAALAAAERVAAVETELRRWCETVLNLTAETRSRTTGTVVDLPAITGKLADYAKPHVLTYDKSFTYRSVLADAVDAGPLAGELTIGFTSWQLDQIFALYNTSKLPESAITLVSLLALYQSRIRREQREPGTAIDFNGTDFANWMQKSKTDATISDLYGLRFRDDFLVSRVPVGENAVKIMVHPAFFNPAESSMTPAWLLHEYVADQSRSASVRQASAELKDLYARYRAKRSQDAE